MDVPSIVSLVDEATRLSEAAGYDAPDHPRDAQNKLSMQRRMLGVIAAAVKNLAEQIRAELLEQAKA